MFVAEAQGQVIGHPLAIQIPQYAIHVEDGSGVPSLEVITPYCYVSVALFICLEREIAYSELLNDRILEAEIT